MLAYRSEYLVERSLGRLKGCPLSLTPMYVQRDDHATGLIRLLSIALRVLTLLEFVGRRQLAAQGAQLAGLYAGNPRRETARPTAERLLEAFRDITLTIMEGPQQTAQHLTARALSNSVFWRFWAFRQRCIQGFAPFLLNRLKNGRTVSWTDAEFIFIGRYVEVKGVDVVLDAAAEYVRQGGQWRIAMYGTGPLVVFLHEKIQELRLSEGRLGSRCHRRCRPVGGICLLSSAVLIPSRQESIPVILSDALQLGRPVIVSDVGDMGTLRLGTVTVQVVKTYCL